MSLEPENLIFRGGPIPRKWLEVVLVRGAAQAV